LRNKAGAGRAGERGGGLEGACSTQATGSRGGYAAIRKEGYNGRFTLQLKRPADTPWLGTGRKLPVMLVLGKGFEVLRLNLGESRFPKV
jgi:hypothetical protein